MKFTLACVLILLAAAACNKPGNVAPAPPPPPPPAPPAIPLPPVITSAKITDYCAGVVTITGANFDSIATKDSVFFGNTLAALLSATPGKLVVMLPFPQYAGLVTVHCDSFAVTSRDSIIREKPVVDSISYPIAGTGTLITIYGKYFDPNPADDTVYFNNIQAPVFSASSGKLQTIVPPGTTTGTVSVHSFCQQGVSATTFINSNKGTLFIATNSDLLYALDLASGGVKWTFTVESAGASYANGVVYAGSVQDNNFYALNAASGKQLWDYPAGSSTGPPDIVGNALYFGSNDGNLYAIDTNGTKIWSYSAGYNFQSSAAYYNGAIYQSDQIGYLYAVSAAGTLNWRRFIWPEGNPAIAGGLVYVLGYDSVGETPLFYALDVNTGNTQWTFNVVESGMGGSPTVANGLVYLGSDDQPIHALNAANGQVVWTSADSYRLYTGMEISNGILYVTSGALLCALDAATGVRLWSATLDPIGSPQGSPTVANGVVYAGSWGGTVYAFDATRGKQLWSTSTGGAPVLSGPVVVDSAGIVYYPGDSGNQQ
jgi:eukaryotic-like serine/threonine-protein kinase